jgi:hypothetical protein
MLSGSGARIVEDKEVLQESVIARYSAFERMTFNCWRNVVTDPLVDEGVIQMPRAMLIDGKQVLSNPPCSSELARTPLLSPTSDRVTNACDIANFKLKCAWRVVARKHKQRGGFPESN